MAERELEPPPAIRRCLPQLLSKHTIFLSHSGEEKAFVEQLYEDLKRMNHAPFFDQEPDSLPKGERFASLIFQAAEQCLLAVVVLSEGYLTSKWPMLELRAFVKARKKNNTNLKLFPVFYKLSPGDLAAEKVETKWVKEWNNLVQEGKIQAEEIALWSDAVRDLRAFNGLDFKKMGTSEVKYRAAVVDEICRCVPPMMKYNIDGVRGCKRMCEIIASMFEEGMSEEHICKEGRFYLGLYGTGGVGKTTLCGAMCSYFQAEFGVRVCHVELPSDGENERISETERISRLKLVIRQLAGFDSSIVDRIYSESQGLECLQNRLRDQPPVFLAVDNVGDSQSSRDEARAFINAGLACGSKVMVTSRSRAILESTLEEAKYCKPIPRLEEHEAKEVFLSVAAPRRLLSTLQPGEDEIVNMCLRDCQFADDEYPKEDDHPTQQYHPLVLRALGAYFHDVHKDDIMRWKEALTIENKLQGSRESKRVNDILGLNYATLSDVLKLIFLDVAILLREIGETFMNWWLTACKWEISLIAALHGVSAFDAEMKVKELQRKSLIYESGPRLRMHDLYVEFAHSLIKMKGSEEWEWWVGHAAGRSSTLERLILRWNKSVVGICRAPEPLWKCEELLCLVMFDCRFPGRSLDLRSLKKLRVLFMCNCDNVEEIVCRCDETRNDLSCYCNGGCLPELQTVTLFLTGVKRIPFLKHCWNLKSLVLDGSELDPSNFTEGGTSIFGSLKALEALSLRPAFDSPHRLKSVEVFLEGIAKLKNLKVLEIHHHWMNWVKEEVMEGVGELDLSVLELLPSLSVLSLRYLPGFIQELKGLNRLSQLVTLKLMYCRGFRELKELDQLSLLNTLDLEGSEGLRKLPDFDLLPSLRRVCVQDCCYLANPGALLTSFQEIQSGDYWDDDLNHEHQCLEPKCNSFYCSVCVEHHLKYGCYWSDDQSCEICDHFKDGYICGDCALCDVEVSESPSEEASGSASEESA